MHCLFFHHWELKKSFNCKAYKGGIFMGIARDIPAELNFYKCSDCGDVKCELTDGDDTTSVSIGFYARKMVAKFGSDPFLNEVAGL